MFDWDVHCGDGISSALACEDDILYMSTHRFDAGGFFPGNNFAPWETGRVSQRQRRTGMGMTVHCGWGSSGTPGHSWAMGDSEQRIAFEALLMPIARTFNPVTI